MDLEVNEAEVKQVVQQLALLGILETKTEEDGEESFSLSSEIPDLEIQTPEGQPFGINWHDVPPIGHGNFESKFSYIFSFFAGLMGDEKLQELGQSDAWEAGQQAAMSDTVAPWLIPKAVESAE